MFSKVHQTANFINGFILMHNISISPSKLKAKILILKIFRLRIYCSKHILIFKPEFQNKDLCSLEFILTKIILLF